MDLGSMSQSVWQLNNSLFTQYGKEKKVVDFLSKSTTLFGEGGESRTHVRKHFRKTFSERRQQFEFRINQDPLTRPDCSYPVSPFLYREL